MRQQGISAPPLRSIASHGRGRGADFRALFVLFGYLFLFQVDTVPGAVKFGFVGVSVGLAMLSGVAVHRRRLIASEGQQQTIHLVLIAIRIMVLFMLAQLTSLSWSGVEFSDWTRDALNYALFPVAMIIGLDWGTASSARFVGRTAILIGIIGGVSFSVAWLERRGQAGVEQFGLASAFVSFAGICLCLALYVARRQGQLRFLLLALVQIGLILLSGGRSALAYSAGLVVVALAINPLPLGRRVLRGTAIATACVLGFVLVMQISDSYAGGVATNRAQWFTRLADQGLSAIASDGSGVARARAYEWLTQLWLLHPLIGRGLGQALPSVATGFITPGLYTLDSPMVVLAKFGVLGTLVLVIVLALVFRSLAGPQTGHPHASAFARTFAVLAVAINLMLLVNGWPMENRGFVVFILLAIAISLSHRQVEAETTHPRTGRHPRTYERPTHVF